MNNDYASHLVLLSALGCTLGISKTMTHVVELGSGLYSTPLWFNRTIWPHIKSVTSYEHNSDWRRHMWFIVRDERLSLTDLWPTSGNDADIILIDNGDNRAERMQGIGYVFGLLNITGLVILHDANESQYLEAIEPHFEHCIVYTGAYPHTALLWNGDRFNKEHIEHILEGIEEYECPNLT